MTNKQVLDNFLTSNYKELITSINKVIKDKYKTELCFSNYILLLYEDIDNSKYELLNNDKSAFSYIRQAVINQVRFYNSDFNKKEKCQEQYVTDVFKKYDTSDGQDDYSPILNDLKYSTLELDLYDLEVLQKTYKLMKPEQVFQLLKDETDITSYNNILKYYHTLAFHNKVLFELIYVEQLSGRKIHLKLNNNIKLSLKSVYRLIDKFKKETEQYLKYADFTNKIHRVTLV